MVTIALQGCSGPSGPKTMRVWGDVSYEGMPVEEGSITFEASDGSLPAQALIKGGHFDPYLSQFDISASAALDWFRTHLG